MVNRLNRHFSNLREAVTSMGSSMDIPVHADSFEFEPFKEEEVFKELSRLKVSKATGIDEISARMLRLSAPATSNSLCAIFNASLATSKVSTS